MRAVKLIGLIALIAMVAAAAPVAAQTSMTWAGSIYGGWAKITESGAPNGSFGARANIFAMLDPVLGVGAEVGYNLLGSTDFAGGGKVKDSAFQATAQAIARGARGNVHPYGTLGLGLYSFREKGESFADPVFNTTNTASKFGVNLGAGLQLKPAGAPVGFGVEGKWHSVFTALPDPTTSDLGHEKSLNIVTVMAGINFK
jgi:hypothetical protein